MTLDGPYAEVTQLGRWTYRVRFVPGPVLTQADGRGWVVWGRKRAEAQARQLLADHKRRQAREAQTWRIS